jgi:hypothetical protein
MSPEKGIYLMATGNKSTSNSRSAWAMIGVTGMVGLAIGASVGYFGGIGSSDFPLLYFRSNSNASPFNQTFDGMARFAGLEMSLSSCGGTPDRQRAVEDERRVIDSIQLNAAKANLAPPLVLARAIVAYRTATVANLHSEKQAFASAVEGEKSLLQKAGWKDTSHDHLASVVRDWDGCSSQGTSPSGAKP